MKRTITLVIFSLFYVISSFSQTIVWKKVSSLPEGFYCGEAVSLNNEIYFVAGRNDQTVSSSFFKFNPNSNQWTKLSDIPNPATNLALAAVNGKIYAIGGDRFQNANREYNPKTNTWKLLEPMPTARQHIDCGVFENKIYITGGLTSWTDINQKHEVYDVSNETWEEKAAIPYIVHNAAVVTLASQIYVIGGAGTKENIWGDVWRVEKYDITKNEWNQKKDLPQLLFKPAAIVVNNQILVLGGFSQENKKDICSDKVFIYKPDAEQWIEITPLPAKNVFFGCAVIGNKIYVIGGTLGDNPKWTSYSTVYEGEFISNETKNE